MARTLPRVSVLLLAALVVGTSGCTSFKDLFRSKNPRDGIARPAELVDFDASLRVERLWTASTGDGEGRLGLRQRPAIDNGRVYTADADGTLQALGLRDGDALWELESGLRFGSGPGVSGGLLVIGGLDGDVLAVNADTGAELWRARATAEVIATPTITSGVVVVRAIDGRVFGFDSGTGQRKWVYDRAVPNLTVRGQGAVAAGQGLVFAGYEDGSVVALRVTDGTAAWEQEVAAPDGRTELLRMADIDGEMPVGLNELYAASYRGTAMAIEAATGRPIWTRDLVSYAGLALGADRVVATARDGSISALERYSGTQLWKNDQLANRWLTTPALQGDYTVVGDIEGYLHWFRTADGTLVARERAGRDPIRATPQVSPDGVLVVATTDGKLAAYQLAQ